MKRLITPLIGTATMMVAYLALRPYGDVADDPATMAAAFASPRWVAAHICGLLSLAQFARLTQRLEGASRDHAPRSGRPTLLPRAARTTGLVGAMLTLPYYGAETFGLHALGHARLDDPAFPLVAMSEAVRNHPVALTLFGAGLISLAASAVLVGLAWQRLSHRHTWAAWPLAAMMAGFLPQFYLPPTGRLAYGIVYALTALVLARAAWSNDPASATHPASRDESAGHLLNRPAT